jgi:hypothetical protein
MANLVSPGVSVSVIDESFYTPAEPGTTPMIFVATAQDKANASGTGTARGTTKANAGVPFLLTSQRDLSETFGDPIFYTDNNNNPIHGGELNEYGLQTAYSYLGVSNRAWVVRADIDTNQLKASATAPAANPADGTYWFDTQVSRVGIFEWNGNAATATGGQSFTMKTPTVITDKTKLVGDSATGNPKPSVGQIGDYVVVATTTINKIFYKNSSGTWVKVGTDAWIASWPVAAGSQNASVTQGKTFTINGGTITAGIDVAATVTAINTAGTGNGFSASVTDSRVNLFSTDGTDLLVAEGTGLAGELGLITLPDTQKTYYAPKLSVGPHTSIPEFKSRDTEPAPTGSVWFKTTDANLGAKLSVKEFNATTALWENKTVPVYANNVAAIKALDATGGGLNLSVDTYYAQSNVAEKTQAEFDFKIFKRVATGATKITSDIITTQITASTYTFTIAESITNQASLNAPVQVSITTSGASADAEEVAGQINSAGFTNIVASVDSANRIVIEHNDGGEFRIVDTDGALTLAGYTPYVDANNGTANLYYVPGTDSSTNPKQYMASNWQVLSYTAGDDAPNALAADGTLWYNSVVDEADIMIHNGTTWVGYQNYVSGGVNYSSTDPNGPIVSATEPTKQSDGSGLVDGDIWVSTADLENYPQIYQYNGQTLKFVLRDSSDQSTDNGVLFADARYNTAGANSGTAGEIKDLLTSNYLDPDAPDPALYPKGMMLFNLRRSGFNVKKFVRNYIDLAEDNSRNADESMSAYYPHRWVTESANQEDGAGTFGRKAQRKVVVQALQALMNSNQDIRDNESRIFNLMATPGYPELIGEMIALNNDRGLTAFIVGDSPFRLTPDATSLNNWATNVNGAVEDNDNGLVSRDEYMGVFYPSLFTSDNAGNNVVVPASHGILRTIALSDQVSYPWFAPAGTRRGGITNASSAGYIDSEGEFKTVALNEGQRDTLYSNAVNPITFLTGAGLVNFGQKTRARNASSLDRINVARLVIYLRSQLNKLAKPYIFEPNDKITRDEIKQQVDSLMLELVGQRALYDFLVVCDESNNTPSRIDRNELYVDIAIEPVKAVEFIYIPLRLKNTGEIAGL